MCGIKETTVDFKEKKKNEINTVAYQTGTPTFCQPSLCETPHQSQATNHCQGWRCRHGDSENAFWPETNMTIPENEQINV